MTERETCENYQFCKVEKVYFFQRLLVFIVGGGYLQPFKAYLNKKDFANHTPTKHKNDESL